MRKNQDGYVLPVVMAILVVLCLIVVAVMSYSLEKLQSQQDALQQTTLHYEFLGQKEQLYAMLSEVSGTVEAEADAGAAAAEQIADKIYEAFAGYTVSFDQELAPFRFHAAKETVGYWVELGTETTLVQTGEKEWQYGIRVMHLRHESADASPTGGDGP